MPLKFIYGMAGCAKSSTLIKFAKMDPNNFVGLAFTHTAVNNLIEKYTNISDPTINKKFQTIHRFFRIPINTDGSYKLVYHKHMKFPKLVLIDEFSLIGLDIMNLIFTYAENNPEIMFIFAGDPLQLSPVGEFKGIKIMNSNNFNFENNTDLFTLRESRSIINHLENTVYMTQQFQSADKLKLMKNYRSEDSIMKILNSVVYENKIDYKQDINPEWFNQGFTFIASTYDLLKQVYQYDPRKENGKWTILTRMGYIDINEHDKMTLTENLNDDFVNGDQIEIINYDSAAGILIKNLTLNTNLWYNPPSGKYQLLPNNYYTAHKSQSKGFDNVCVIINNLFSPGMLYTMITRAKKRIEFVLFGLNPNAIEKEIKNITFMNNVFTKMVKVVY